MAFADKGVMHSDHGRNPGPGVGAPTGDRLREWVAASEALADGWQELLAHGFEGVTLVQRGWVREELIGFARILVQRRWERLGALPKSAQAVSAGLLAADGVELGEAVDGGCSEGAGVVPGATASGACDRRAGGFEVTPEMFQRFASVTGMDTRCLAGAPEQVAGLMLYVVVFSVLTLDGGAGDLEMQRLLKRLRLCREQFAAQVDALFGGGRLERVPGCGGVRPGGEPTTHRLQAGAGEGEGSAGEARPSASRG